MISKSILKHTDHCGFKEEEVYGAYKIFFSTLVSEPRLRIINLLRKGKKNVSEIMSEIGMDQTSASHNLARLRKCGFVIVETNKKFRYYKLNEKTIGPLMILIDEHMKHNCIHILRKEKEGSKNGK